MQKSLRRLSRAVASALIAVATCARSDGQEPSVVRFVITVADLPSEMKRREDEISENVLAAARMWADVVLAKPCLVEIVLKIMPWPARGFGHSVVGVPLGGQKANANPLSKKGWLPPLIKYKAARKGQIFALNKRQRERVRSSH